MRLDLTVIAKDRKTESLWKRRLQQILDPVFEIQISGERPQNNPGHIVLVDESIKKLDSVLEKISQGDGRSGRAVYLVVGERSHLPLQLKQGLVDDILVTPFRALEVVSKIRFYHQLSLWNEVNSLSVSFSELLSLFKMDLQLAERLQKSRLPKRFPKVKGFEVLSRYIAGSRPGGDFFDLAESSDGKRMSLVLSKSSSYGLSSAILSVLMKVTMKLTTLESGKVATTPKETVQKIREEILLTMGPKDHLSLFFGTFDRESQNLSFVNRGSSELFVAGPDAPFKNIPADEGALSQGSNSESAEIKGESIKVQAGSRIVLLSAGFIGAMGRATITTILNHFREKDATDLLNELVFQVKSKLDDENDLPEQDCTAIVFDAKPQILKFARQEQDEN